MQDNPNTYTTSKEEKQKLLKSMFVPFVILSIMWMVWISETVLGISFSNLGIYPGKLKGLAGVIFSPFLHGSLEHIFNNSIPVMILGTAIFYFYRQVAYRVVAIIWLLGGIGVWLIARPAHHIGASGLVYGFASFLFFSGVTRQNINLLAISLIVVFLYGSLVWGIFPIKEEISWEGHLCGGTVGFVLSFYYRKYGPQRTKYRWDEDDEDDEEDDENGFWNIDYTDEEEKKTKI